MIVKITETMLLDAYDTNHTEKVVETSIINGERIHWYYSADADPLERDASKTCWRRDASHIKLCGTRKGIVRLEPTCDAHLVVLQWACQWTAQEYNTRVQCELERKTKAGHDARYGDCVQIFNYRKES